MNWWQWWTTMLTIQCHSCANGLNGQWLLWQCWWTKTQTNQMICFLQRWCIDLICFDRPVWLLFVMHRSCLQTKLLLCGGLMMWSLCYVIWSFWYSNTNSSWWFDHHHALLVFVCNWNERLLTLDKFKCNNVWLKFC